VHVEFRDVLVEFRAVQAEFRDVHVEFRAVHVEFRAVQVEIALESAWFQPLNLECDALVLKFAFKFTNCTDTPRGASITRSIRGWARTCIPSVGLYKFVQVESIA
jgi:hypothetical protein